MNTRIIGVGSYIPKGIATNNQFENHSFYNEDGSRFGYENTEIIKKFEAITGISERRYIKENLTTSDIAFYAAEKAIADAKIDK